MIVLFFSPGGLFDMPDQVQEVAFRFAVDHVNLDRSVLPDTRLTAQIERIPAQDSFYAAKQGEIYKDRFPSDVHLQKSNVIGEMNPLPPPQP